jgi:hypothetical protein
MLQYQHLASQVESIHKKHAIREREVARLAEDSQARQQIEVLRIQRIHHAEMAAKNMEIQHFRAELDAMLAPLQRLQVSQTAQ